MLIPEKIRELARRGEAWGTSEARQMLEYAIEVGRGGVYLRLTPEQYAKLKRSWERPGEIATFAWSKMRPGIFTLLNRLAEGDYPPPDCNLVRFPRHIVFCMNPDGIIQFIDAEIEGLSNARAYDLANAVLLSLSAKPVN